MAGKDDSSETARRRAKRSATVRAASGKPLRGEPSKMPRSLVSRLFRWLVVVAAIIILVPLALVLIYTIPGTKPWSTLMIADAVSGQEVKRIWAPLEDIPAPVWQSVLMSEDGQFCNHHGVDLGEMKEVVDKALSGEKTRGASTIPMQLAKNLFLWPSRSYLRKGLEVPLALLIDAVWSKRRIMEVYLNIAEWGPGVYGIASASRHHFGRRAGQLTRRQAALLTVALPNPHLRNPAKPSGNLARLAQLIEKRARGSGAYVGCLADG